MEADLVVDVARDEPATPNRERQNAAHTRSDHVLRLGGHGEYAGHRLGVLEPPCRLGPKVRTSARRDAIVPRPSVVLGDTPLGPDQSALFHAIERLVECRVIDLEAAA